MSLYSDCLVPRRLSLEENVRAKQGGKKTTGETSPAVCTLPMVPCSSSPVARFYLAKNKAPEEEADTAMFWVQVPSPNWLKKCQEEDEEAVKRGKQRSRRFSFHKYFTTFFYLFFSSITLLYIYIFLYFFTHDIYPWPTKFSFTLDLVI